MEKKDLPSLDLRLVELLLLPKERREPSLELFLRRRWTEVTLLLLELLPRTRETWTWETTSMRTRECTLMSLTTR